MSGETVRTTVVLPANTANTLRELIPPRKRSEFVAEAVQERLKQILFQRARARSFGAWNDEDHPGLRTHADMCKYISQLRNPEEWRSSAKKGE